MVYFRYLIINTEYEEGVGGCGGDDDDDDNDDDDDKDVDDKQ
jgi:hypothetical protein